MKRLALTLLALSTLGCGVELDRSSEVKSLRVLGMHKTKSYAQPGDEVTFSMLWHDAEGREVTPQWFVLPEPAMPILASLAAGEEPSGDLSDLDPSDPLMSFCVNPPQDSYYGCLLALEAALRASDGAALDWLLATNRDEFGFEGIAEGGRSMTVTVPRSTRAVGEYGRLGALEDCDDLSDDTGCADIVHPTQDPRQPNFGSLFVWYALCPGELSYDGSVKEGFPMLCLDEDGEAYGSSDYVFGYSQIFVYDRLLNRNPVFEAGMEIDGERVDTCAGVECLDQPFEAPTECGDGVACLDVCDKEDEDECDEIDIKPIIPKFFSCNDAGEFDEDGDSECSNAELDQVAFEAYDRNQTEQMWIRYYADQGRVASDVRLLNDALTGWNEDYGTELRIPNEPGPLTIWAVAADNRGGQNWVRAHAVVR